MKKLYFIVAIVVALVMTGCQKTDYKAQGEQMAEQLDELCQKNDTAAVISLVDSIGVIEADITAKGDTAAYKAFHAAIKEARERCMPMITVAKINQGQDRKEVLDGMIDEALNGDMDIEAITKSIDASIENENKKAKK